MTALPQWPDRRTVPDRVAGGQWRKRDHPCRGEPECRSRAQSTVGVRRDEHPRDHSGTIRGHHQRVDDDYRSQAGAPYRPTNPARQAELVGNIAGRLKNVRRDIRERRRHACRCGDVVRRLNPLGRHGGMPFRPCPSLTRTRRLFLSPASGVLTGNRELCRKSDWPEFPHDHRGVRYDMFDPHRCPFTHKKSDYFRDR